MTCINCNSEYKPFFGDFHVCEGCGLYKNFLYPNKKDLKERLKNFLLSASKDKEIEKRRLKKAQDQIDVLNEYYPYPSKGKVFDVAASGGFFLKVARDNGWEIDGNEVSEKAVEWADNNYNIRLRNDYFTDEVISGEFDVVVFWNSLEHMHNPLEALVKTKQILKDKGMVYIRVPNKDEKMLKNNLEKLHSYEFNKKNLNSILNKAGFEEIFVRDVQEKITSMDLLYQKK